MRFVRRYQGDDKLFSFFNKYNLLNVE